MYAILMFLLPFLSITPSSDRVDAKPMDANAVATVELMTPMMDGSILLSARDTIPANGIYDEKDVDEKAEFKGGEEKWNQYITKKLNVHITDFGVMDYGVCIVKFIVDAKGKVSKVEPQTKQNTKFAEVLIDALTWSPKWIPAVKDGKPVKSYRTIDVILTPPDYNKQ
ncbi:MAG: hypothetical protein J5I50_03955 [Chitinophagaceae bacterium]|nr:hypothetical protein [Chitinophagaceae bacterium]